MHPAVIMEAQNPIPAVTMEAQNPIPAVTTEARNPIPAVTTEVRNPIPAVIAEMRNPIPAVSIHKRNGWKNLCRSGEGKTENGEIGKRTSVVPERRIVYGSITHHNGKF